MRMAVAAGCFAICTVQAIEEHVKNSPQIAGGVTGAVVGFGATLLILGLVGLRKPRRPHRVPRLLMLFVFSPGRWEASCSDAAQRSGCAEARMPQPSSQQLQGIRYVDRALCRHWYGVLCLRGHISHAMAQPERRQNPLLVFEIRLPAGTALPNSPRDIAIELQTDLNRMPGEPRFNLFSTATTTGRLSRATSNSLSVPPIGN